MRSAPSAAADPRCYDILADDWDVEARCRAALDHWGLPHVGLTDPVDALSGGERTKLCLAGISVHNPSVILLDEPTNHLDTSGRRRLYDLIRASRATIVVVSHDVALLNLLGTTCELSAKGLKVYGGNYDFYRERKRIEEEALAQQVDSEQTALRLARKKAQEVRERQERRMRQGERHKDQLPRILRRTMKDSGERTEAQLVGKHAELIDGSRERLDELRRRQRTQCELKIDFDDAQLHDGKLLVRADGLNFEYAPGRPLWREPLSLEIRSGERIRLTGDNGTGKTTLVRLLTGELEPTAGRIGRADFSYVCLDQQYSRVNTPQSAGPRTQTAASPCAVWAADVGQAVRHAERRRTDAALPLLPDDRQPCSRSLCPRRADQQPRPFEPCDPDPHGPQLPRHPAGRLPRRSLHRSDRHHKDRRTGIGYNRAVSSEFIYFEGAGCLTSGSFNKIIFDRLRKQFQAIFLRYCTLYSSTDSR